MRILLDTGSLLVNLALQELFLLRGIEALSAFDTHQDFLPDIVLLGNNFDKTITISKFPRAKILVLDIGLSVHRFEEASRSRHVDGILPRFLDLEGFTEEVGRIFDRLSAVRSLLNDCLKASHGPSYN